MADQPKRTLQTRPRPRGEVDWAPPASSLDLIQRTQQTTVDAAAELVEAEVIAPPPRFELDEPSPAGEGEAAPKSLEDVTRSDPDGGSHAA